MADKKMESSVRNMSILPADQLPLEVLPGEAA